jgi:hypothetical protein
MPHLFYPLFNLMSLIVIPAECVTPKLLVMQYFQALTWSIFDEDILLTSLLSLFVR